MLLTQHCLSVFVYFFFSSSSTGWDGQLQIWDAQNGSPIDKYWCRLRSLSSSSTPVVIGITFGYPPYHQLSCLSELEKEKERINSCTDPFSCFHFRRGGIYRFSLERSTHSFVVHLLAGWKVEKWSKPTTYLVWRLKRCSFLVDGHTLHWEISTEKRRRKMEWWHCLLISIKIN